MAAVGRRQLLNIEPLNELEFYGPFTTTQTTVMQLQNPTSDRIAFKVKTTVPKRYCVKPSAGIVEPHQEVPVHVMLQPFEYDNAERSKHKFMIQSVVLDADSPTEPEQIFKNAAPQTVADTRLKCSLKRLDELMSLDSPQLLFEGSPNEKCSCSVTAKNTTSKDLCFKVKRQSTKRYVVQPFEGIIKPRESQVITIQSNPSNEVSSDTSDKLVFVSAIAPKDMPGTLDKVWALIDKMKISEKVIPCVFAVGDNAAAHLHPSAAPTSSPGSQSDALRQLTQEIERLKRENVDLKETQARLRRLNPEGSSRVSAGGEASAVGGQLRLNNVPPLLYMLAIFILALFVGKFIL